MFTFPICGGEGTNRKSDTEGRGDFGYPVPGIPEEIFDNKESDPDRSPPHTPLPRGYMGNLVGYRPERPVHIYLVPVCTPQETISSAACPVVNMAFDSAHWHRIVTGLRLPEIQPWQGFLKLPWHDSLKFSPDMAPWNVALVWFLESQPWKLFL
jgi:hypothetical protein